MKTCGYAIRRQRETLGLTQKAAATAAGISPQYLNDIERDRRSAPPATLAALSTVLTLPPNYLHLMAGRLPPNVVISAGPDSVVAAFDAMRRSLQEGE